MNNKINDSYEIDLLQLAQALLKKWWIIIISAILGACMFFGYTFFFVTPQYTSSVLFYVNNSSISFGGASVSISTGELNAAKTLVDTYCVILKTRLTLEDVSEQLKEEGLNYSYRQLYGIISNTTVNNTEIFRITVTDPNPENACIIANTVARVLPRKISDVVDGASVRVVDYAVVSTDRTSPSYSKNAMTGFLAGFAVACAAIVVLYLVNDKLDSEEWLLSSYKDDIPLLATVPDADYSSTSKYNRHNKQYYNTYMSYDTSAKQAEEGRKE